jgi:glycosyltransferase involved in cell wall biosynthesis
MTRPSVSVCIPVYNGERYLARAIESVLAQTIRPLEILVLDDGSTDSTSDVAARYPAVRTMRQPNRGIGYSRQRLVEEARGDWIAFLDHDDYWLPEKLERQCAHTDDPRVGLVHTDYVFFYEDGREVPCPWRPTTDCALDHVLPDCWINNCSVLVRREALLECGGFDTGTSRAEDWLMWLLLASRYEFRRVEEPLTRTLRRPGSASAPTADWFDGERQILEERILPRFDELYARIPDRGRFRRAIHRKLGTIASLQAQALERQGLHRSARPLHLEAVRRNPTRGAVWRCARHFLLP